MGTDTAARRLSVSFGLTRACWNTSSISRRADTRQFGILQRRPLERCAAGSSSPGFALQSSDSPIAPQHDLPHRAAATVDAGHQLDLPRPAAAAVMAHTHVALLRVR